MQIFISFGSKERFRLSSAKLRCFQHYVSENRLFPCKLCFWPFVLSKTCFGVLAMRSDVSSILLQKNSDFVFPFGIPFFESHGSENTFFVCWQQNCAALSFISQKKNVFAFSLLKQVGFSFIAQKTCFGLFSVILLFSVLLHQKKVFFQYAGSHPGFHLILLRQRFCFPLAELRCLRIVFLRTTLFSVSITKLNFGRSILLKNFLACWQLN